MGFSMCHLEDTATETLVHTFMEKHFPGCQFEGIREMSGRDPYAEYDVWLKDNPIIQRVVLTNNWSPNRPATDSVFLKEVCLHSGMELIPDDLTYHKLVKAAALLKAAMYEIEE